MNNNQRILSKISGLTTAGFMARLWFIDRLAREGVL